MINIFILSDKHIDQIT